MQELHWYFSCLWISDHDEKKCWHQSWDSLGHQSVREHKNTCPPNLSVSSCVTRSIFSKVLIATTWYIIFWYDYTIAESLECAWVELKALHWYFSCLRISDCDEEQCWHQSWDSLGHQSVPKSASLFFCCPALLSDGQDCWAHGRQNSGWERLAWSRQRKASGDFSNGSNRYTGQVAVWDRCPIRLCGHMNPYS